jgi:predicted ATPase/class 3 adenylate cyclase
MVWPEPAANGLPVNGVWDPAPLLGRSAVPSGTVTFAFTDILGSTERWERDEAAMREALRRHDALMRTSIASQGGYVFKTIGDAFCASFWRPQDAVAAMVAAQRALAAEDFAAVGGLRVRAAIHTGTADERDGDYFGGAVNRVARLVAAGHGGQILVSAAAAALLAGELPPETALRDLGDHRLKDLARPERVFDVLVPELGAEFPPLRSLDALPNNLPLNLTSFVSRDAEIAEITALVDAHRLVTLVGAGGIGKTRTSLQVAARLLDGSGDGVWFVELAPLSAGGLIATTVAQAMHLTLADDAEPLGALVRALFRKRALLVFDNCEHLIDAASQAVAAILHGCPEIKILASSRQALGVAGEETYRLSSLRVPLHRDAGPRAASDVSAYPAVALFVERARAVERTFELTDDNAGPVAEICRRLDGIPLAIELAAARVTILSPHRLQEKLDDRFRLLTGGKRDVLPRQQTLRALIGWSYDLLDEPERAVFRRLGSFVSGFAFEGAVAVAGLDEFDEIEVLDRLESLVDKSLVVTEYAGEALRYRLLESTRLYAREKLEAADERGSCSARHLSYLSELFLQAEMRYENTLRRAEFAGLFETELDDVRAALDWAGSRPDPSPGAELLAATRRAWGYAGLRAEGLARGEAFLARLGGGDPRLVARVSNAVSYLAANTGRDARAFEAAVLAVGCARACDDPATLASALVSYSDGLAKLHRFDEAQAALEEAERIPSSTRGLRMSAVQRRAVLSAIRGDAATSALLHEQLREEFRSVGDASGERIATVNLAEAEHARGRTHVAVAIARELLEALEVAGDPSNTTDVLANLAGYLVAVDDAAAARGAGREVIRRLAERDPEASNVTATIEHLALALALDGNAARAAKLAGYADAAFEKFGFERQFTERATYERLGTRLRESYEPAELTCLLEAGAAMTPGAALALALLDP